MARRIVRNVGITTIAGLVSSVGTVAKWFQFELNSTFQLATDYVPLVSAPLALWAGLPIAAFLLDGGHRACGFGRDLILGLESAVNARARRMFQALGRMLVRLGQRLIGGK